MSLTYYFLPTRNVFGEGAVNEAGKLMKSLDGTHPMIVTDAFLAKSGMADQVKKILEDEGLPTYIFGGAEPDRQERRGWRSGFQRKQMRLHHLSRRRFFARLREGHRPHCGQRR